MFKLIKKSKVSNARLGVLKTARGCIKTPFFMPVATRGAIKHISSQEMRGLGAQILLSNTYHLMLKPGPDLIKKAGGLHKFMDWDKPILTDSGGFQIFSLAQGRNKTGESLVKLDKNGVGFKSCIDGKKYYLTPEKAFAIQKDMGVDIAVCLDECVALPAGRDYMKKSVELTSHWAKKTKAYYRRFKKRPLLHAVIQGGLDKELRLKSLADLTGIGFDGYNIGGLSVGETAEEMYSVLDYLAAEMPEDKPRYLMGVGYPENIVEAVKRGVDMFDCVIPTREGRHGRLFFFSEKNKLQITPASLAQVGQANCKLQTSFKAKKNSKGQFKQSLYCTININRSDFVKDFSAINKNSKLPQLRDLSKAYLHYLFKIKEPLGQRLATLNNLEFYLDLMAGIRYSIKSNIF